MASASFLRLVAVAAGVVLTVGVAYWLYQRHQSELVERSATIENAYAPLAVDVEYEGKVVSRVAEPKGSFRFRAPRRVPTWLLSDELSFYIEAPCGRQRLEDVFVSPGEGEKLRIDMMTRSAASLVVDNRSLPAGELSAGEVSLAVAADHASRFTLFLGSCRPLLELRWQGQRIGEAVRSVLVDPSGSRCYALRHVKYSALGALGIGVGDDVKHLGRAKVHSLDETIDYLFESAPESVESATISADRDELTEEACP
jgi:hypothetical protein